jgi:hypothetical protein
MRRMLICYCAKISRDFVCRRTGRHPYERVPTPYQMYSWLGPQLEHNIDAIRAEDAFSSKLGYEEHIPGQTRYPFPYTFRTVVIILFLEC